MSLPYGGDGLARETPYRDVNLGWTSKATGTARVRQQDKELTSLLMIRSPVCMG